MLKIRTTNTIFLFWFVFLEARILKVKEDVWVEFDCIEKLRNSFNAAREKMKLTEMAFEELTFRIMEFPNTLVLITGFLLATGQSRLQLAILFFSSNTWKWPFQAKRKFENTAISANHNKGLLPLNALTSQFPDKYLLIFHKVFVFLVRP